MVRTAQLRLRSGREHEEANAALSDRFWINAIRGLNVLTIALLGHFRSAQVREMFDAAYRRAEEDELPVKIGAPSQFLMVRGV